MSRRPPIPGQVGLFDPPAARNSDTSIAAADSMIKPAARLRGLVFDAIRKSSDGMTCDEVEVALDLRHQTASARVNELCHLGQIVDTGRRRPTRSGRQAAIWRTRVVSCA